MEKSPIPHKRPFSSSDFDQLYADATSFDEVERILMDKIDELRQTNGNFRIGFVSGPIANTDVQEEKIANMRKMSQVTKMLQIKFQNDANMLIFSSLDIFNKKAWELWKDLDLNYDQKKFRMKQFCRNIVVRSTDLYMMPGWQTSEGAKDEYNTAKFMRLIKIHHLHPDPAKKEVVRIF